MVKRTRLWCFTNFDLDFDYESIIGKKVKFVAFGKEKCPSTGRDHHQGYIYFRNQQRSLKFVSKLLGGCHVDPCSGSLKDNETYCSKETALTKFGDEPKSGTRMDIQDCMKAVKEGVSELKIAEDNPALWCQYGRRLERYRDLLQPRRHWKTEVHVYWGPPDTGKTRKAWEIGGEDMDTVKFVNGFCIGYKNAPNVLIDDFDRNSLPRDVMLQIFDRYPCKVNVKGAEREWNPRRIFLTTNFDPKIWADDHALYRRLTKVEYFGSAEWLRGTHR